MNVIAPQKNLEMGGEPKVNERSRVEGNENIQLMPSIDPTDYRNT